MLAPRSVAVVGVSSRPSSLSARLLANLVARGYRGRIVPVNPRAAEIQGLRCAPTVQAIGEPVELAILMVPRDAALEAVEDCVAAGVGGVVVITAGFREVGAEGAAVEAALRSRLRTAGVRMVGPNCMGIINTAPELRLDATFSPVAARPGGVAFASHSGALGVAVLEAAREAGLAFARFVSLGNSADVTACDLLELWADDDAVRVVMLYLEAIEEPRRFLTLAERITRRKPIVVLKAGRTDAGQRAASSHTGALAAEDTAIGAMLRQAGVLRAPDLATLYAWVAALQSQPLPRGRRVAIVTNAGGPAIAAADALAGEGLELAELPAEVSAGLRATLPPEASVGNPVDMLPSAMPADYARAVEAVRGCDGVDAVVAITVTPILTTPLEVAGALAALPPRADKPLVSVFMTAPEFYVPAQDIPRMPPVFRFPELAVGALGAMASQSDRVAAPVAVPAAAPPSRVLAGAQPDADGFLGPDDGFALLAEAGVPTAAWRVAPDAGSVATAGQALGFPLVLKAFGPGIVHKTELGAVAVGIADAAALDRAVRAMAARLDARAVRPAGFLVQRQIAGRELIVGIVRREGFGPLVMCGLGGVAVEVFRDVAFRLAPVSAADAEAMLGELRGKALFSGFRGQPTADRAALVGAIAALAALAAANPAIAELDVNPLLVLEEGRGCVAVDVRVRLG